MGKFTVILGLVLVSITLLAIACTGDQGLAGPAGPQGEQGPAGAAGPQGGPGPVPAPAPPGAQGPQGAAGPAGEPASTGPADAPVELVTAWAAGMAASGKSQLWSLAHPKSTTSIPRDSSKCLMRSLAT